MRPRIRRDELNYPDGLTRIPFVECDPVEEHGGYGDVKVKPMKMDQKAIGRVRDTAGLARMALLEVALNSWSGRS